MASTVPPATPAAGSSNVASGSSDAVSESTDTAPERTSGLRERSKAKRRALIQRTAIRLFAERGFEQTTLADIAEEAELAVRTVTGYFPSKLELATSFADEIAARLTTALAATPETDLVDVLDAWLVEEGKVFDPEFMALTDAMWATNPDLRALANVRLADAAKAGDVALVALVGLPADDPTMELCLAAVQAVIGAYFVSFATHPPTPERHGAAISYLRAVIDAARTR